MRNNEQIKEVFVFGAGASNASARTPLGKDLVWAYYESCSTWYEVKHGKPTEHDLRKKREEFVNYGKFLQLTDGIYPELDAYNRWHKNMNEALMFNSPAEANKKYYIDEMAKVLLEKDNKEGITLVRQLVLEHITGAVSYASNALYKEFVRRLAEKSPELISIISMNFDTLLHEDFVKDVYFDYLVNFDVIERKLYKRQDSFSLIKLNGSLDWAICPKCGKIKLLSQYIDGHLYRYLHCDMSKNCKENLIPFIFLPHEDKDELINTLRNKAREKLKQANKITIIGYSFPYYDKDIINLFRESTNDEVLLEIIDKDKQINEWLKSIFSNKKNLQISLYGFEGYIKEGKPIAEGAEVP